ncbi:MAG: hypothetical protein HY960_11040 [Ignavibacteriae bacterium]|nr:hypothetical protein [Ignavibacteriota bacterium]
MRYIFLFILLSTTIHAQDILIKKGNREYPGKQQQGMWLVTMDSTDYVLLKKNSLDSFGFIIDSLEATITLLTTKLTAQEKVIEKCDAFERKSDSLHVLNNRILDTLNVLYRGYKGLYEDAKKLITGENFSLFLGGGIVQLPSDDYRPVLSLGAGIGNWFGQYSFGSGYKGILLGVRYGLPF